MADRYSTPPTFKSKVTFLAVINVLTTAFGLGIGLMNALFLGSGKLGVTAVVAALCLAASTMLDFRIGDAITSAFYTSTKTTSIEEKQASLVYEGALLALVQALLACTLGALLCITLSPFFTVHKISMWWILAYTAGNGAIGYTSLLVYLLRFSERYTVIGYTRLITTILSGLFFIILVPQQRSLTSYFTAFALGTFCSMIFVTFVYMRVYQKERKIIKLNVLIRMKQVRALRPMLLSGNLFSYTELLHRTGDSLVVAFFCSDAITGMYKVMRSLINCLSLFYDTVAQVSTPQLLKILERRQIGTFLLFARRTFATAAIVSALIMTSLYLSFPPFIQHIVGESYRGIELPTIAMTSCLICILGIQLWAWPVFLYKKAMLKLAKYNGTAASLHISCGIILYSHYPDSLWPGTLSFLVHYLFLAIMYFLYTKAEISRPS